MKTCVLCGEKDKKKKEILSRGYLLGYYDTIAAMMSENRIIKKKKNHIKWPNGHSKKPCICTRCDRELGQDEVKVIFCSNTWGDMRTKGKVKCKICGAKYCWNDTWWS